MNEDRTFLGNGWSFPPALDKDGTPTRMSAYEENIRQSLWTLLSTSPGERVHRYDYGCPVRRYVFEIMDISTQTLLRDEIERAVVMFEPRVDLNRVEEIHKEMTTVMGWINKDVPGWLSHIDRFDAVCSNIRVTMGWK